MQQLRTYINAALEGQYPEGEIRSFFFWIMEEFTGASRADILANKYNQLSETQIDAFKTIVARLQNFEPLQYILGETEFYGLRFKVKPAVLIPRPETEELVAWVINTCDKDQSISVLDIGTGSACIAVSLAFNLQNAKVQAFDISADALVIAKQNAELNGCQVDFKQLDVLDDEQLAACQTAYDVIVSNPPYICEREKLDMEANVLNFEPSLALFVPDTDPLLFYREIAVFAFERLFSNGKLFFEINRAYAQELITLLQNIGFTNIELRKDFYANDRMIKAEKP